jgi:hypothetical protein
MSWYVARLIVECEVIGGTAESLVEEQWKLIEASDSEVAYRTALQLGADENHSYENSEGQTVRWSFKGLSDLEEILAETIGSGTEICSTFFEGTRAEELVRPKSKLTTSWVTRNRNKTAGELLAASRKPYAPR